MKAFSTCRLANLDQAQVREVGAGVQSWVRGARLRSQHAGTRQGHRPQELCKHRILEINSYSG